MIKFGEFLGDAPGAVAEPINPGETPGPVAESDGHRLTIPAKLTAFLAGVALLVGGGHELSSPAGAEASARQLVLPAAVHTSKAPGTRASVKPFKCMPKHQVKFTLTSEQPPTANRAKLVMRADSCKTMKTKPVQLQESGPLTQAHDWKIKQLRPKTAVTRSFSIKLPKAETGVSKPAEQVQTIVLKALSKKGSQLGKETYKLKYRPGSKPGEPGSLSPELVSKKEETCDPNPNYRESFQDDRLMLQEQTLVRPELTPAETLDMAAEKLGASVVRINVIWGKVQGGNSAELLQPYIDAVDTARAHGYQVHITFMPNPGYMPGLQDQSYNSAIPDPSLMAVLAGRVASALRGKVAYYSPTNEFNHEAFNQDRSIETFKANYLAGRAAILAADPDAKILAGELAPSDQTRDWIEAINELPKDGVSIHPYGDEINDLSDIVRWSNAPVYVTEYGNAADDPQQADKNRQADRLMYCSGVVWGSQYQLLRTPWAPWSTGRFDPPQR